jgi:hypothetical protein
MTPKDAVDGTCVHGISDKAPGPPPGASVRTNASPAHLEPVASVPGTRPLFSKREIVETILSTDVQYSHRCLWVGSGLPLHSWRRERCPPAWPLSWWHCCSTSSCSLGLKGIRCHTSLVLFCAEHSATTLSSDTALRDSSSANSQGMNFLFNGKRVFSALHRERLLDCA